MSNPTPPPPTEADIKQAAAGVAKRYDWRDSAVHQWAFRVSKFDTAGFIGGLFGGAVLFPILIFGALWLIGLASQAVAYWLGMAACGLFVLVLIYHLIVGFTGRSHEKIEARAIVYWTAVATLGSLLFVLYSPVSDFKTQFAHGDNAGLKQWLLFFLDNTCSVILLDIPEVYDWQISNIVATGFWGRFVTVAIRVLISLGLIELALAMYRTYFVKPEPFYSNVKDCYYRCDALPDADGVVLQRQGVVRPVEDEEVAVNVFVEAFKSHAAADEKAEESAPAKKA